MDIVFPQTKIQLSLLQNISKTLPASYIVPNTYNFLPQLASDEYEYLKSPGIKNLLVFSYYYPHKNIEIVMELARLIKSKGLPFRIILIHPILKAIFL